MQMLLQRFVSSDGKIVKDPIGALSVLSPVLRDIVEITKDWDNPK